MVLTTDTRLKIKRLLTDLFYGRNMTNETEIAYAIDCVCLGLEKREAKEVCIDNDVIVGAIIPIALLHMTRHTPVVRDNKKYLGTSEDTICVFASTNYAKLVKESISILKPNCWGDVEDVVIQDPVYTTATCRDMDGIYDTLYYS